MVSRVKGLPRQVIEVTQEDIDNSIRETSSHCMIADAIKRGLGGKHVSVDVQSIRWTDPAKGVRYIYFTPPVAQRALVQFDLGMKPEPFTFRVWNGQVIASGQQGRQKRAKPDERVDVPKQRRFVRGAGLSATSVPNVAGGQAPPIAALSNAPRKKHIGTRREFGLRRFTGVVNRDG